MLKLRVSRAETKVMAEVRSADDGPMQSISRKIVDVVVSQIWEFGDRVKRVPRLR